MQALSGEKTVRRNYMSFGPDSVERKEAPRTVRYARSASETRGPSQGSVFDDCTSPGGLANMRQFGDLSRQVEQPCFNLGDLDL